MPRTVFLSLLLLIACNSDKFLEGSAHGVLSDQVLSTEEGIYAVLIGAYAMLDGYSADQLGASWASSGSNWVYGDVMSDDAHLGSAAGSCCGGSYEFEEYRVRPGNSWVYIKWVALFESIRRANDVLKLISQSEIAEDKKLIFEAEARFLRGHYYFEGKKLWNNLPFFDENTRNFRLPNYGPTALTWQHIIDDFIFAIEHLPDMQEQVGRANRYAALAYLAKAYLFSGNYASARTLLDEVIQSGAFELLPNYHENFDANFNNNREAIFQVQMSVNDGTESGQNGNYGDILNFPHGGGPAGCCGFHQPSQNLVNAFRTNQDGLPYLENFNQEDVINDEGLTSDETFEMHTGPLDMRLDWTVGRRGIPYWDWGPHPGNDWIRQQSFGGPYSPKKRVFKKSNQGTLSQANGWAQAAHALNYSILRYADVLLWRAEVAVEENDLETARMFVNQIRQRAMNSEVVRFENGEPAANYQLKLYDIFPNQIYARKAVRFERRLEFAMEGHRFFDLVRWGIADEVLNTYVQQTKGRRYYLSDVFFEAGVHEYLPIPQRAIEESITDGEVTLRQNEGY